MKTKDTVDHQMYLFNNGYGASIITESIPDHWELAVLSDNNTRICYDTSITDDVLRYLDKSAVERVLVQIENLPPYKP